MRYGIFYIASACTMAYVLMIVLGLLMRQFVSKNLTGANNQKTKKFEVQKHLTRLLIIMASIFNNF